MHIKQINTKQQPAITSTRPSDFSGFVGQKNVVSLLQKAIISATKRTASLGHTLFAGPSGYGKTTIANIVANQMESKLHTITAYAISKPADIISIFNMIGENDILFIDEIHRLHPKIEEILYIAMEDFAIDMVMPDGGNVRIPLKPFTLIGATTKLELLSDPLKNRFVYTCHFEEYTQTEKELITKQYLDTYVQHYEPQLIAAIANKVDNTPRNINNLCIKIRDYLVARNAKKLTDAIWLDCEKWLNIDDGGLTSLHRRYLQILSEADRPIGLKTLAIQLGLHEKSIEHDIEPLLIKLKKVEKTVKGRVLVS